MISESAFKKIMSGKDDVNEEEICEMLNEYYRLAEIKGLSTSRPEGAPKDEEPPPPPPAKGRRASKARQSTHSMDRASQSSEKEEKWINYKGRLVLVKAPLSWRTFLLLVFRVFRHAATMRPAS